MKLFKNIPLMVFLAGCLFVVGLFIAAYSRSVHMYLQYEPKEGDIVFQSLPKAPLVVAIEGVTQSPWSHCGIVARRDDKWVVIEALGNVKETGLFEWIHRSRESNFEAYRFVTGQCPIPRFIEASQRYLGRKYDARYRMDDERIYCSELVYKAYRDCTGKELAPTDCLGDMDWKPYTKTIEYYEGGPVPIDREMITPVALTKTDKVRKVYPQ